MICTSCGEEKNIGRRTIAKTNEKLDARPCPGGGFLCGVCYYAKEAKTVHRSYFAYAVLTLLRGRPVYLGLPTSLFKGWLLLSQPPPHKTAYKCGPSVTFTSSSMADRLTC